MPTSPTQRSLKYLRDLGFTVAIVEHFNHFVKVRQDLFGFIDLVALDPVTKSIIGVQTTSDSGGNVSAHIKKILDTNASRIWLDSGGRIVVHGWGKKGARDKRKLWTLRQIEINLDDYKPS